MKLLQNTIDWTAMVLLFHEAGDRTFSRVCFFEYDFVGALEFPDAQSKKQFIELHKHAQPKLVAVDDFQDMSMDVATREYIAEIAGRDVAQWDHFLFYFRCVSEREHPFVGSYCMVY